MDIKTIIKNNLPEGVEINEKDLNLITKEIKLMQGEEFIPKADYRKKIDMITELEKQISDLKTSNEDIEVYKGKISELENKYKSDLEQKEQEFNEFKNNFEIENTKLKTRQSLQTRLLGDNLNPKYADIIIEKTLDKAKLDDQGNIADYDDLIKPHKDLYPEWFATIEKQEFVPANTSKKVAEDLFIQGFDS